MLEVANLSLDVPNLEGEISQGDGGDKHEDITEILVKRESFL